MTDNLAGRLSLLEALLRYVLSIDSGILGSLTDSLTHERYPQNAMSSVSYRIRGARTSKHLLIFYVHILHTYLLAIAILSPTLGYELQGVH